MTTPVVETEDGYPTEASIAELAAYKFGPEAGARFLLNGFPEACKGISCCSIHTSDSVDFVYGPGKLIEFSTGGWSGAEELIDAMLGSFWIKRWHRQWRWGGHYEFFVPDRYTADPADAIAETIAQ